MQILHFIISTRDFSIQQKKYKSPNSDSLRTGLGHQRIVTLIFYISKSEFRVVSVLVKVLDRPTGMSNEHAFPCILISLIKGINVTPSSVAFVRLPHVTKLLHEYSWNITYATLKAETYATLNYATLFINQPEMSRRESHTPLFYVKF